jgi:hypothetical protein
MDFNSTGEFMVTSGDDEQLHLYSVDSATYGRQFACTTPTRFVS